MGRALYFVDEDAPHLGPVFPPERALTVEELGMRGASDDDMIAEGDDRERFIAHAGKGGKRKCTDLHGLVMFYGHKHDQVKHFPLAQIERRLRLDGKPMKRRGVYQQNLLVRVKASGVTVERLPRCP